MRLSRPVAKAGRSEPRCCGSPRPVCVLCGHWRFLRETLLALPHGRTGAPERHCLSRCMGSCRAMRAAVSIGVQRRFLFAAAFGPADPRRGRRKREDIRTTDAHGCTQMAPVVIGGPGWPAGSRCKGFQHAADVAGTDAGAVAFWCWGGRPHGIACQTWGLSPTKTGAVHDQI